jgi:DNA-binding beta-propeller fold protein YncE
MHDCVVVCCRLRILIAVAAAACGSGGDSAVDGSPNGGDGGGPSDAAEVLPPLTDEGVSTLTGSSFPGSADGPRGTGRFDNPVNVAVGPDGRIYVADFGNDLIRAVDAEGAISTVSIDDPTFGRPFGIAFAASGALIAQTDLSTSGESNGALWSVDVAGGGATLLSDGLGRMRGLARLGNDHIAMADQTGSVVATYDLGTSTLTPLAGQAGTPGFTDGIGAEALFNQPYDIVELPNTNLLVADRGNHRIRQVTLAGEVTTFAGDGTAGTIDGPLATARFNGPQGLAFDGVNFVYVSDVSGRVIRRIDLGAQTVTTIAGTGDAGWQDSEDPLQAQLFGLEGIDLASDGTFLFIADGNRGENGPHHRIRRLGL